MDLLDGEHTIGCGYQEQQEDILELRKLEMEFGMYIIETYF